MDVELLITIETIVFWSMFGRHPLLNNDNRVKGLSELICQSFGAIFAGSLLSAAIKSTTSGGQNKRSGIAFRLN